MARSHRCTQVHLRGKHDGSVESVRYFKCEDRRGLFVRPRDLRLSSRDNV